jgi:phage terminase small subunit
MTEQELQFCGFYALTGNGTQSAKQAGFPEKSAHVTASRLLKKDNIAAKIAELQDTANKELVENTNVSRAYVVKRLIRIIDKAEKAGNQAAAINGLQWLGKSIAMFTERLESVTTQSPEQVIAEFDGGDLAKTLIKHFMKGFSADDETVFAIIERYRAGEPVEGGAVQAEVIKRQHEREDVQERATVPQSPATH